MSAAQPSPAGGPLTEGPADPEHDPRASYALEPDYVANLTRRILASSGRSQAVPTPLNGAPLAHIPQSTPVDVADEKNVKPWSDAAGAKLGFIFGDQKVADGDAKFAVPVFRHGMVRTSRVPGTFAVPTTAAQPQFVFIEGSDA